MSGPSTDIQTMLDSTIPIVLDEESALACISEFSRMHVVSLDDCNTGMIPSVMLYEKEDEKQSLSIKQIRDAIRDMSEKPYEGKILIVFRDFDSASIEAMNASLKFLEEPPPYVIILLVVSNPENILDTIKSRTISRFVPRSSLSISTEIREALERYRSGEVAPLLRIISTKKLEKYEAVQIAREIGKYSETDVIGDAMISMGDLLNVNESPKNILDRLILKMG